MSTASAPMEIGRVALTVHDLNRVGTFYEAALGLERLSSDRATASYGAGGRVLIELRADPAARRAGPTEAGLFHTAILLPSRADLGAWLIHAGQGGVQLQGASDHLVSEAIYLADPEGNGIEIYRDRPRAAWSWDGPTVAMATARLDLNAVAASAAARWDGTPAGTVVGHVHLQAGALPAAEAFYAGRLGLAVTAHYPGAAFYSSGGYHHHLATNTWNSSGAGPRSYPSTGLADLEIRAVPAELARLGIAPGTTLQDPWGTSFTIGGPAAGAAWRDSAG